MESLERLTVPATKNSEKTLSIVRTAAADIGSFIIYATVPLKYESGPALDTYPSMLPKFLVDFGSFAFSVSAPLTYALFCFDRSNMLP